MIDEVRIYKALPSAEEIAILACPDSLSRIAAIPPQKRTEAQRLKIRNAFLERGSTCRSAAGMDVDCESSNARGPVSKLPITTVMVMQELPEPRPAFVLKRGAYDARAKRSSAAFPRCCRRCRKSLAEQPAWASRDGWSAPNTRCTARVTVNRFWQMFFGTGLVKTVEDFGAQGEAPSHPELLDWLAVEFQQSGWDVKAMLKTIVIERDLPPKLDG